ncbi:MAG: hypothetical protein H6Q33_2408 [Deltaproteobacteria bacterium]|nr:hypothetical protein [Deltaproteobacteria bacterium]
MERAHNQSIQSLPCEKTSLSPFPALVEAREYIEAGDYSVEEMRKILPGQLKILQGQG